MALTAEQIRLFRHNGFLKHPNRLPEDLVDRLKEAVWKDIRGEVEPVVRDREGRVVRISSLLDRDPIFLETVSSPLVLDPLESLLGPNIELITNRHNHAILNVASTYSSGRLHRDMLQWSRPIVTIIFYLEETTVENGCTLMIPGTQLLPGARTLHGLEKEAWISEAEILDQALPVPMRAGEMLVIDSLIFHGVGKNRTDGTRMSMTVGYHSVDELSDMENPQRILVRGERVYMGNNY